MVETRTVKLTGLNLMVLASVVAWLWVFAGAKAHGQDLQLLRACILGLGIAVGGIVVLGRTSGYGGMKSALYTLALVLTFGLQQFGAKANGTAGIELAAADPMPELLAEVMPADVQGNVALFKTLMALHAQPYVLDEVWEDASAVQAVGKSTYSPVGLGGF